MARWEETEKWLQKQRPSIKEITIDIEKTETTICIITGDSATNKDKNNLKEDCNKLFDSDVFQNRYKKLFGLPIPSTCYNYDLCLDDKVYRKNIFGFSEVSNTGKDARIIVPNNNKIKKLEESNNAAQAVIKEKDIKIKEESLRADQAEAKLHDKSGDSADIKIIQSQIDVLNKLKDKNSIYDNRKIIKNENNADDVFIELAEYGKNNTQIFTRETDINKMISSIGRDKILNPETTILEPTSGDGAFTTRILKYRLEKLRTESLQLNDYILKSLQALSTIYSIEYEPDTVYVQRCNLYTTMRIEFEKYWKTISTESIEYNVMWENLVKEIIFQNIIWGEFAATNHPEYKNYESILGFDRASGRPLSIIKWTIKIDKKGKITYKKELIS